MNKVGVIPTSLQITEGPDAIQVPVLSDGRLQSIPEQYAVTIYDQDGNPIYGSSIVWSLEGGNQPDVLEMSSSGLLTVYSNVEGDTVTIKATCGGASATKAITLEREEPYERSLKVDGPDTIRIPATGSIEANYTAHFYDQYGRQIPEADESWPYWELKLSEEQSGLTLTPELGYETVLTVEAGAQPGRIQLHAEKNHLNNPNPQTDMTIELVNKEDPGLTLKEGEGNPAADGGTITIPYGEYSESNPFILQLTKEKGEEAGGWQQDYNHTEALNITLNQPVGSTRTVQIVPKAVTGKPVTVSWQFSDDDYFGSITVYINVAPKMLTADDLEYDDSTDSGKKVYDGTMISSAGARVKAGSLVGSDTLTITGAARYDDPNAGTGKTTTFTPDPITSGNCRLAEDACITVSDGEITPRPAQATRIEGVTKEYDGTTEYTGDILLTVTGLIPAEAGGSLSFSRCTFAEEGVSQEIPLTFAPGDARATGFQLEKLRHHLRPGRAHRHHHPEEGGSHC